MNTEEAQDLIKKSILSARRIVIDYTNSRGKQDSYKILAITSTWSEYLKTRVMVGENNSPRTFRYDRINSVEITEELLAPSDRLLEKIKDGTLFIQEDRGIARRGGIKGYRSTLDYVSKARQTIDKKEAKSLIEHIDIPKKEGWSRGVILDIEDGDSFEILLETDSTNSHMTRLFGVDAPECREDSPDHILGLEAKVLVEDMFAESRYCYVNERGVGAFRRYLMDIRNSEDRDVAILLLENGLGVPMMGYLEEPSIKILYEGATKVAYGNRLGVWAIDDIYQRYNNIIGDTNKTEIDILRYIPDKKSAFARYLRQSPKAKIIRCAIERKCNNINNKKKAKEIFDFITSEVTPKTNDLEALKKMCDRYLEEIAKIEEVSPNREVVNDCILHIEELVDELELGEGEVKGNFSKGQKKLLYHNDPDSRWYQLCIPEIRFKTVDDAKSCGFKKA